MQIDRCRGMRPSGVTMRPEIQERARAIIRRVLSAPASYDSKDVPKVTPKVWAKATNYLARRKPVNYSEWQE